MFNQFGDLERCALRPGNVHSAPTAGKMCLIPSWPATGASLYAATFAPMRPSPIPMSTTYLEAEGFQYAIRLPANQILQEQIGHLLTRPVGRPPHHVRRYLASFRYQAKSWTKSRRVIAKVEWHPGELYPRVGFIVTNMTRPAEKSRRLSTTSAAPAEQWIKEGKNAIKWTRLSCRTFEANAVRLQLHALAYNLGNFMRTLAMPEPIRALVADEPAGEARSRSARRSSATAATSLSRWLRSRCPGICSEHPGIDRQTAGDHLPRWPERRKAGMTMGAVCPGTGLKSAETGWKEQLGGTKPVSSGGHALCGLKIRACSATIVAETAGHMGNVG